MVELEVRLDFLCASCGNAMGVTLRCAGRGLRDNPLATIAVPCPTCCCNQQIRFRPDGTLHEVVPIRFEASLPEPSWN